ncbi:helix-turn-helix domain-containing protein [Cryobacterium arcticum]|uniref:HTH cro/C1-type domain-containing protein n=1 Tax=Cryobacterium arcticum TaxID=670052 RepID=A0A1B1BPH1_9MICO|nr:helix-turn-helix transcriptional regulator [Cryobacterium arcticum]ANP74494.1 hypothetical protein PA27867_3572 [Cryobacterium arcticum]
MNTPTPPAATAPANTLAALLPVAIRAELLAQGLTQKTLCDAWSVTQPAVSVKLSGKTRITDTQVEQAAYALGMSPFDLIARAGQIAA